MRKVAKPDGATVFADKIVQTKQIMVDKNGMQVEKIEEYVICSCCGTANPITASMCKMCSNYLEPQKENKQ